MTKTYSKTRILVEGALMIALSTVFEHDPDPAHAPRRFHHSVQHGAHSGNELPPRRKVGHHDRFRQQPDPACAGPWQSGTTARPSRHRWAACCWTTFWPSRCWAFACLIAKPFRSRTVGVGVSAFVVCLLRFLCSFLSGYIVWKDYDYAFSWMTEIGFPGISNMSVDGLCWLYSAVYNATYMLPEAILTTVLVVILIRVAPQIFDPQNARA